MLYLYVYVCVYFDRDTAKNESEKKDPMVYGEWSPSNTVGILFCFKYCRLKPFQFTTFHIMAKIIPEHFCYWFAILCLLLLGHPIQSGSAFITQRRAKSTHRHSMHTNIHTLTYSIISHWILWALAKLNIKWQYIYLDSHSSSPPPPHSRQNIHKNSFPL